MISYCDHDLKNITKKLKGVELGLESINSLLMIENSLKKHYSNTIVPEPVLKTTSIALEGIHKLHKLENVLTLSLEDNQSDSVFQKIIEVVRNIWKKIVETFNYIWEVIVDFFTSSKGNAKKMADKVSDIKEKQSKPLAVTLKDVKYDRSSEFKINNQTLVNPLNFLNLDITDTDLFKQLEKLEETSVLLKELSDDVLKGYKDTETEIVNNIRTNDFQKQSPSAEEIDGMLFNSFFNPITTFISKNNSRTHSLDNFDDKIEVLLSLNTFNRKDLNINSICIVDGFIDGGLLFVYVVNNEVSTPTADKQNANIVGFINCLAVNKVSDTDKKSELYYITPLNFLEFISILEKLTKKNITLEEDFNNKYKIIKNKHKTIRSEIDKMINDKNITSIYQPENFREKFEILRNITQSMLRFALDGSKAYGMFSDSILYFTKLSEVNADFYESLANKH